MDLAHPRIIPVKIWPDFNVLTVKYSQIKTHLKILPYAPTLIYFSPFPIQKYARFLIYMGLLKL